jgi:hypothetical protein
VPAAVADAEGVVTRFIREEGKGQKARRLEFERESEQFVGG